MLPTQSEFTWVNKTTVDPDEIRNRTASALKVVVWAGGGDDWCAYLGPSDWPDERVANEGNKISKVAAESLFPVFSWSGRYYRGD